MHTGQFHVVYEAPCVGFSLDVEAHLGLSVEDGNVVQRDGGPAAMGRHLPCIGLSVGNDKAFQSLAVLPGGSCKVQLGGLWR